MSAQTTPERALFADSRGQGRRVTIALHGNRGQHLAKLANVVSRELDGGGTCVLLHAFELRGARNRHNPRFLRKQPRESNLRWRRPSLCSNGSDSVDQRFVGFAVLRSESRNDISEIVLGERRVLIDLAGQEPFCRVG